MLVAAIRSRNGASFRIVSQIPSPLFQLCVSLGLYLEWQEVLCRPENIPPGRTRADAIAFVRSLLQHASLHEIHFLWRPVLNDADDDMILELAFSAGCEHIVTHNIRDFRGSERFGIVAITPREFLQKIGL